MEFIIDVIQLPAVITLIEEPTLYEPRRKKFPTGIHLSLSCSFVPTIRWAHQVSAKSERGYADLLERTSLAVECTHIAGVDNPIAYSISRPTTHVPSLAIRHQQVFAEVPRIAS